MIQETAVKIKIKKNNNNITNDCDSQSSGYMETCQIKVCSVNRWRELVDYAPINVKPAGGGWGGRVWGGDLTFFQKFCRQIPAHGLIIPVNCNQSSLPRAAHCCQISEGWTQERQNKNIFK